MEPVKKPVMPPEIAAEAAVWVARLHGPDRSPRMERECLAWQARSAAHRLAFERCTDTWQDVAGVTLSTYACSASVDRLPGDAPKARRFRRRDWAVSLTALMALTAFTALAALALGGVLVLQPWRSSQTYSTGVGEQRVVILQDGTRMTLNTATRVKVELAPAQRTVRVEGGEALFEVAKDARRPFVVQAAGAEVVATGTAFEVRLTPGPGGKGADQTLAVTLVEGHVIVRSAVNGVNDVNDANGANGATSGTDATGATSASGATGAVLARPILLEAGERVRLSPMAETATAGALGSTRKDRPRMDQVLAWTRGEVIFDDVSLLDAVAEMNRYSRTPIKVREAKVLGPLRVSGLFQTEDNASFARAVAALHGLVVQERADGLEIAPK